LAKKLAVDVWKNYICTSKSIVMETKLTIRLKKKVIERAKAYAQNHKISLSKMVESYLESVTEPKKGELEITPLVESLSGVIHLSDDFDLKKDYSNYLTEKYK
jgi:hypothetical protein